MGTENRTLWTRLIRDGREIHDNQKQAENNETKHPKRCHRSATKYGIH